MFLFRWAYLAIKYYLAAMGAIMLVALFFERSIWLGISMLVLVGLGLRGEIEHRWTTRRW